MDLAQRKTEQGNYSPVIDVSRIRDLDPVELVALCEELVALLVQGRSVVRETVNHQGTRGGRGCGGGL